jgi:N-acetylmuramoyl-L-alanine amidase
VDCGLSHGDTETQRAASLRVSGPLWPVLCCALLLALFPLLASSAPPRNKAQARAEFQRAEQLRAELEAKPEAKRQPGDYLAVIRAYDRVVQLGPTTSAAPDSLLASARLQAEMGRLFGDPNRIERAAEKYRFLIKEYPHSKLVKEARKEMDELSARRGELAANAAKKDAGGAQPAAAQGGAAEASAPPASERSSKIVEITNIRHWATASYTRVVIELSGPVQYQAARIANPNRIFFDLQGARLAAALPRKELAGDDGLLKRIRVAQNQVGMARLVLEVGPVANYSAFVLPNPYRLVIDINGGPARPATAVASAPAAAESPAGAASTGRPARSAAESSAVTEREKQETAESAAMATAEAPSSKPVFEQVQPPARIASPRSSQARREKPAATAEKGPGPQDQRPAPPRAAQPSSDGHRSLIRALGLKIGCIVIDPGHGGHDTGTIGPTGLMEKDLVLDVAKRLGGMIEDRLGGEVIYTRSDDTFVPLEGRTGLANQKQADLFVSIHANSSRAPSARGVETYYLNFTSSADALEVAARENAVSEKSIHELQDLVKKITLKEKLEESREFASDVQRSLYTTMARGNAGLRNRGVKKAPFVVLIGANMPSILAEISFVSNPSDERLLRKTDYRQKIAEALYRGIQKYANSLAGVKVAASRIGE